MRFEDVKFSKNGKSRKWEDLNFEEQEALREQIRKQLKEKFERNWGFKE